MWAVLGRGIIQGAQLHQLVQLLNWINQSDSLEGRLVLLS